MRKKRKQLQIINIIILFDLIISILCIKTLPAYAANTTNETNQTEIDTDNNQTLIDYLTEKAESSRFLKHKDSTDDNIINEEIDEKDTDFATSSNNTMIEKIMVIVNDVENTNIDNEPENITEIEITIEPDITNNKSSDEKSIEKNDENTDKSSDENNDTNTNQETKTEETSQNSKPTVKSEPYTDQYALCTQGTANGPSGHETYYNLDMSNVITNMRNLGYKEEDGWVYWVREEDGCKMFGPYVICAAELNSRPKGTILSTSMGDAIVCDTGDFVYSNPTAVDIATVW